MRINKVKTAVLGVLTAGMVYSSACSAVDLRYNLVAGTQSFVKGYTTDLLEALFPAAEDLFATNDDAE